MSCSVSLRACESPYCPHCFRKFPEHLRMDDRWKDRSVKCDCGKYVLWIRVHARIFGRLVSWKSRRAVTLRWKPLTRSRR